MLRITVKKALKVGAAGHCLFIHGYDRATLGLSTVGAMRQASNALRQAQRIVVLPLTQIG
jgi:hypothetical protein